MVDEPSSVAISRGSVDLRTGVVRGRDATLSPTELRLLRALVEGSPDILSREELLQRVWGLPASSPSRTLYATIERLRRKVEENPGAPEQLLTVAGRGYQFRPVGGWTARPEGTGRHLDDFVGRRAALDRLGDWLLGEGDAPIAIHGPEGIGRSRLLAELARIHGPALASVTWVDGRGVRSVDGLCARLAAAVQHPVGTSLRDRRRLSRILGARGTALLVLDDVDELGPELEAWLTEWPAPRPRVAVVSQRCVLPMGLALGPMDPDEARVLFEKRAGAHFPRWEPSADELDGIRVLVERVHGSPLAVELLAGPAAVLGAERLARAMDAASWPTLTRLCDWVWDRRSSDEQRVIAALSLLQGTLPLDVAEALLERLDLPLLLLGALVRDGVLKVLQLPDRQRCVLVPSALRAAAARHGDLDEPRRAHASLFGAMGTEDAIEELTRHGDRSRFARVLGALDDLRSASGRPGLDGAHAGRLASYLLLHLGAVDEARTLLDELVGRPGLPAALRVWLVRMRGEALRRQGDLEGARAALDKALAIAENQVPEHRGRVLHARGVLESVHAGGTVAEELFRQAMACHVDDPFRLALSEAELATVYLRRGAADDAIPLFREALRRLRGLDCPVSEVIYLGNAAVAHMALEQFDAAQEALEMALSLAQELEATRLVGTNQANLGLLAAQRDDLEAAASWYEDALRTLEGSGGMEEAVTRVDYAEVLRRQGRWAMARRVLDQADRALRALDLPLPRANALLSRAALARAEGRPAAEHVAQAAELIEAIDAADLLPRLRCEEGHLSVLAGDVDGARTCLAEARAATAAGYHGRTEVGRAVRELVEALGE